MPYDSADPRAAMNDGRAQEAAPAAQATFAEPQVVSFLPELAQLTQAGSATWYVRTQNAVIAYTQAVAGERFEADDPYEHIVVTADASTRVQVQSAARAVELTGPSLAIVPAGPVRVEVQRACVLVRVFTAADDRRSQGALNAALYAAVPAGVAVRPPRHSREQLRTYRLADFPADPARFGHIFRSGNLMVSFVPVRSGPRDPSKLSPHSHADFEQCTIQLEGDFIHHVRTPWTADGTTWRDDQHLVLSGPGAVIFPPPLIHTSQAVGEGVHRLLDVFAPPRQDFLAKQGWVLNADEYDEMGRDLSGAWGSPP